MSDLFKELKERLSSPFFFSFIIAWCFINWKIIVGLLFYKIPDLQLDGYSSYIDLVSKNINTANCFTRPVLISLAYTFLFPFFKNCILAFNAWTKSWSNNWNLRISKTSKISMMKYIALRENYEKQSQLLEQIIEKENMHQKENAQLKVLLESEIKNKNTFYDELQKWKNANSLDILNGEWEYTYSNFMNKQKIISKVNIMSGVIQFYENEVEQHKRIIKYIYNNPNANQIFLAIESHKQDAGGGLIAVLLHQRLSALDNMGILRGYEDNMTTVEYRKIR